MYVMIDNFDSFVYNLKAYFQELGRDILVKRCDEITLEELEALNPEQVVIEIDAEDFAVATGQQNIACRLYVPSNGKIFALGSYVLQCRIESN